jgi:hypothetical protein
MSHKVAKINLMYRTYWLLPFIILLCSALSYAQEITPTLANKYVTLLESDTLRPLDGIWSVNLKYELIEGDSIVLSEEFADVSKWALLYEDGQYQGYNIYTEDGISDMIPYTASFTKTSDEWYSFNAEYPSNLASYEVRTLLTGYEELFYSFDANKTYIEYKIPVSGLYKPKLRLKYLWFKEFPTPDMGKVIIKD